MLWSFYRDDARTDSRPDDLAAELHQDLADMAEEYPELIDEWEQTLTESGGANVRQ